jgi:p-cumate 2,3-dioxygenase ferredoxin subunit
MNERAFKTKGRCLADVVWDGSDVRGTRIAVANVGGPYYAFDDACTHEQCSLAEEGELTGTTVTCTCHGSEFDVRTGRCSPLRRRCRSRCTPVQVAGDALQIEV